MSITPDSALGASGWLQQARDAALAAYQSENQPRTDMYLRTMMRTLNFAARELGYTLTPIVTPSPDSGRAKEIGDDVYQNIGA